MRLRTTLPKEAFVDIGYKKRKAYYDVEYRKGFRFCLLWRHSSCERIIVLILMMYEFDEVGWSANDENNNK